MSPQPHHLQVLQTFTPLKRATDVNNPTTRMLEARQRFADATQGPLATGGDLLSIVSSVPLEAAEPDVHGTGDVMGDVHRVGGDGGSLKRLQSHKLHDLHSEGDSLTAAAPVTQKQTAAEE